MIDRRSPLRQLAALISGQLPPESIPLTDWEPIASEAHRHGLGPTLLHHIHQNNGADIPQLIIEKLQDEQRQVAAHLMLLEHVQRHLQQAFDTRQVPVIWLKGLHVAHLLYPDPAMRPIGDLDVLVQPEDRSIALKIAQEMGYHSYDTGSLIYRSTADVPGSMIHHDHLRGGPGDKVVLEIHYRLFGDQKRLPDHMTRWMFDNTHQIEVGGVFCRVLIPEALLIYLLAHLLVHHGGNMMELRHLYDVHLLMTNQTIDVDKVVDNATELRWTHVVERGLILCEEMFSTSLPPMFIEALQTARHPDEVIQSLASLQGTGGRVSSVMRFLRPLIWSERLRVVWHTAFPPVDFMRRRYQVKNGVWVGPYYIRRWMTAFKGLLIIGWRMLTGQ